MDEPIKYQVVYLKNESKMSEVPITPGQVLYIEDTHSIYFDNKDEQRVSFALVVDLQTDLQRTSLGHPINAIYFVQETGILWKYTDKWIQLTGEADQQIVFANYDDFPEIGMSRRIYVDGIDMYRWVDGKYQNMNKAVLEWGSF